MTRTCKHVESCCWTICIQACKSDYRKPQTSWYEISTLVSQMNIRLRKFSWTNA